MGAHQQNGGTALTVYFDAFAHDYLSEPLIALVGALLERSPKEEKPKLERLKRAAIKFVKPATRTGLNIATFGAKEAVDDLGDAFVDAIKDEADQAVNDLWKREEGRRQAMKEFHAAIEALTTPENEDAEPRPLVIVVDELDRCRPDYALEVLEVIKHFFAVENVHFVLGVNLTSLENSVKARYGGEIEATAYLQKFLSFTMSLPDDVNDPPKTPAILRYVDHLGRVMATPAHLLEEVTIQLKVLIRRNHISIRDIGKIMGAVALLPKQARGNQIDTVWRDVMITLIITRVIRPDLFQKLLRGSANDKELVTYFDATVEFIDFELQGGKSNQNYKIEIDVLYSIWSYICSGEAFCGRTEVGRKVEKAFGDCGARTIRANLQKIFRDWLSVAKID